MMSVLAQTRKGLPRARGLSVDRLENDHFGSFQRQVIELEIKAVAVIVGQRYANLPVEGFVAAFRDRIAPVRGCFD